MLTICMKQELDFGSPLIHSVCWIARERPFAAGERPAVRRVLCADTREQSLEITRRTIFVFLLVAPIKFTISVRFLAQAKIHLVLEKSKSYTETRVRKVGHYLKV